MLVISEQDHETGLIVDSFITYILFGNVVYFLWCTSVAFLLLN